MVQKFKTKDEKHAFDDEKRRESLKKKLREQQSQKELIKNALSESVNTKSRKIVFDDEIVGTIDHGNERNITDNSYSLATQRETLGKQSLFEESESDKEGNYEINIKSQFEGKMGQKLLYLQSNYNNDERFRLDERFHDHGDNDDDDDDIVSEKIEENNRNNSLNLEQNEIEEEKAKQLKVLETVLGDTIASKQKTEIKPKKSFFEMVRFDASNEDHKRQVIDEGSEVEGKPVKKKKKLDKEDRKKKRKQESEKNESLNPSEAEKKFYQVSDDLKVALKNRKNENCHFSLLEAFSKKLDDGDFDGHSDDEEVMVSDDMDVNNKMWTKNEDAEDAVDFGCRKDNNEELMEMGKVRGIIKETFFLIDDDPRIEEGLKFINMKNSEEAGKAMENYDDTRREIREVLRLRWQKHRQRKNPFKKKIGGSNKQMLHFNKNRKEYGKVFSRTKH